MNYMGAAEFEFGALGDSLKEIRSHLDEYIYFQNSFVGEPTKVVTIFCKRSDDMAVLSAIQALADGKTRTKCSCDFKDWVYPEKTSHPYNRNDFWWDIDNHFMFWKLTEDFQVKFKEVISYQSDEAKK